MLRTGVDLRCIVLAACVVAVLGQEQCGELVPTPFEIHGTIQGETLVAVAPFFISYTDASGAWTGVVAPDAPGVCADLQQRVTPLNTHALDLGVHQPPGSGGITPGTYPVTTNPGAPGAVVTWDVWSASCTSGTSGAIFATGGQVSFTSITATELRGTFDVTFANGDHVTGSFDVPPCQGYAPSSQSTSCDGGN